VAGFMSLSRRKSRMVEISSSGSGEGRGMRVETRACPATRHHGCGHDHDHDHVHVDAAAHRRHLTAIIGDDENTTTIGDHTLRTTEPG